MRNSDVIVYFISEAKRGKMKRIVLLSVLIITAAFFTFPAFGQSDDSTKEDPEIFDPAKVKIMDDIFSYEDKEECQVAYTEEKYIYVFQADDIYYRAVAELPEDVSDALWALDFFDADHDQKVSELISPLEIASLDNLTEMIPDQKELDQLIGKTGRDLFEDGWTYSYYNLADMEAGMDHGPFEFIVRFEYEGEQMVNSDEFDFYEEFKDLPVFSVTYDGLGDAAELD